MQVVKGDQIGWPVPKGIARPPCPWVYIYGGQGLQVGGWLTGSQPVRKPKLWPQNSQTEWH